MSIPPPPPPSSDNSVIAGLTIGFGIFMVFVCCLCTIARQSRAADAEGEAVEDPAPRPANGTVPPELWDNFELLRQRQSRDGGDEGHPRRVSPVAAVLPSFTYNQSMKHDAKGGGEEAATCSVCLGMFETGETVRLLPVCLHLFHVECIDPWLDAHSTCPICRSGIDATTDSQLHPPV